MMSKPVMLLSLIEIHLQNENRLPEFCSIRMLHKALFQGDWLWCIIPQFATKITSCILRCVDTHFEDDVVWLAPFLTNNVSQLSRTRNTAIYVSVCVVPWKHWFRGFSSEGFPIIKQIPPDHIKGHPSTPQKGVVCSWRIALKVHQLQNIQTTQP